MILFFSSVWSRDIRPVSDQVHGPLSCQGERQGPGGRRHQGDRQEGQGGDQDRPAQLHHQHRQQREARPVTASPRLQLLAEDRRDSAII